MLNTPPIPPEQPSPGSTTTPPQPASTSAPPPPPLPGAPGTDPAERVPIAGMFGASEAILRQPRRVWFQLTQAGQLQLTLVLLGIAILGALAYGLVVGTFTGGDQLWAAPVKIAGGLLLSGLICLPSLYIFACLSGAHTRLAEVCGHRGGLRHEVPRARLRAAQRAVRRRPARVDHHLRARAAANDGGAPAHPRHQRRLPADGEKVLRQPLGGQPQVIGQ